MEHNQSGNTETNILTREGLKKNEDFRSKEEISFISNSEAPLFAINEKIIDNNKYYFGYFSFRLEAISRMNSVENAELIHKMYFEWHKNLFQLIRNQNPNINFKIKFLNNSEIVNTGLKNPLSIYFSTTVANRTYSETIEELKSVHKDLSVHFEADLHDTASPYYFTPVMDKNELLSEVFFAENDNLFILDGPTVQLKENNNLGFNKSNQQVDQNSVILPKISEISDLSLENMVRILSKSKNIDSISLILRSIKMEEDEKIIAKSSIGKFNFNSEENNSPDDYKKYNLHIKKIIQNADSLFMVETVIVSNMDEKITKQIQNAVGNAFYDSNFDSKSIPLSPEVYHQHLFGKFNKVKGDFRFYYTPDEVFKSFRFPLPSAKDFPGLKTTHPAFYSMQNRLANIGVSLGEKNLLSKKMSIKIAENDLRRHIYILGQTGVGKTTLIKSAIFDLINKGEGIALVDPHGDLLKSVLENIPLNRQKDVILFDPTDLQNNKIRINILEYNPAYPEQRTFIFNELMKILNDMYDMRTCAGPGFELYFRTFKLLVMSTINGTLADVIRAFRDVEFRNKLLEICTDNDIKSTIENFLANIGEYQFDNWVPYITNKFNRFVQDDFIAPIISERVSNINFREIIDNKKILLVRLPKGKLGDEGLKFLGTIILNRIILAAYSRENINEEERVDFTLFVDEFQNFTSSDICTALAEARKYHLRLVLANQNFGQLDPDILKNLLGNIGNLIAFRPGLHDAFQIEPYFSPLFTAQDLLELPNFHCVARVLIDNVPSKPFIFQTIK